MRDLRKWESDGVLTGDLSSWQRSAFTADEVTFSSMEQYMMANVIQGRNKGTEFDLLPVENVICFYGG